MGIISKIKYNNYEFVIFNTNGENIIKKITSNGEQIDPSREELEGIKQTIIKQIQEEQKQQSYTNILNEIKRLINTQEIKTIEDLENYINGLNLSDEKKLELYNECKVHLNSKDQKDEIIKYKDELFKLMRQKDDTTIFSSSFKVSDNPLGGKICSISINLIEDNKVSNEISTRSFDFTEELKTELIEKVIEEMVLANAVSANTKETTSDSFGMASNIYLTTAKNFCLLLRNIDNSYADYLEEHINQIKFDNKIDNPEQRDDKINELYNKKMDIQEKEQILNDSKKRVLRKDEDETNSQKGFVTSTIIYAIVSLISSITFFFQIIILK